MYLVPPCYGYASNCQYVYEAIPGTRPLCKTKQNVFVLFICNRKKSEIQIYSNKHETGLIITFSFAHCTVIQILHW